MSAPSAFAADWLSLREPIDHRSRAVALDQALTDWLARRDRQRSRLRVLDLGSGAGSNLRYLAPRLKGPQHWTLVDHDAGLLKRARETDRGALDLRLTTHLADLNRIDDAAPSSPDLVTASAWLDLVSADWIERFVERAEEWSVPVLIALSVDGRRGFVDPDGRVRDRADDQLMREAFNEHQRQPKGLGVSPALGPDAAHVLAERLAGAFVVTTQASDWLLPAGSNEARTLGIELLDGWAASASEARAEALTAATGAWHKDRSKQIVAGGLGIYVGHQDLLALPKGSVLR